MVIVLTDLLVEVTVCILEWWHVAVHEDDAEEEGGEQQHGCTCDEEGEAIQAVEQSQEEKGTQGRPNPMVATPEPRRHFRIFYCRQTGGMDEFLEFLE